MGTGLQGLPDDFSHKMLCLLGLSNRVASPLVCGALPLGPAAPGDSPWSVRLNKPMSVTQPPGELFGLVASQAQILEQLRLGLNSRI